MKEGSGREGQGRRRARGRDRRIVNKPKREKTGKAKKWTREKGRGSRKRK